MVEKIADELLVKLNGLQEELGKDGWKQLNRRGFMSSLNTSISHLEGIEKTIKEVKFKLERDPGIETPNLEPLLRDYGKTINLLQRNLAFEQTKKLEKGEIDFKESIELPEMYSAIEQRILSLLLKTRFLIERVHLYSKMKTIHPLEEKSTAKNLLHLLQHKEQEFQNLKFKFDEVKEKGLLGRLDENRIAELESEVNSIARKIELEKHLLASNFAKYNRQLEILQSNQMALNEKANSLETLTHNFVEKSLDLVTELKKERDAAKKLVLQIEDEGVKLRSAYSKELLNAHSDKVNTERIAEERAETRIDMLNESVKEKKHLIEELKKMLHDREEKINELERKIKK